MPKPDPTESPSADGRDRANENRTTHNESINTDAQPSEGGSAEARVEPQLPHDIDESPHSQARSSAAQVGVGEQAYADTLAPSRDTDRGPVADALYNEQLAPDRGVKSPRK